MLREYLYNNIYSVFQVDKQYTNSHSMVHYRFKTFIHIHIKLYRHITFIIIIKYLLESFI